jgi:tetratricopeptide (TPR) repeat protein
MTTVIKFFKAFSVMEPSHPKQLFRIAIALFSLHLSCFAENTYWIQYGRKPVYVRQIDERMERTLKFVHYKGNRLFLEMETEGATAEISLPVSKSMISTLHLDIDEMELANNLIFEENYYGAVELLRPKVYPLIRFHKVPEIFSELHTPIRTLIKSLIEMENFSEAEDLLSRISLNYVDIKYSELAIELLDNYLLLQDYDAVTRVVNQLPVDGVYSENIAYMIRIANILRGAGKPLAVIPIYRKIERHVSGEQYTEIRMWLAYSLILVNKFDEASLIIDALEEPDPDHKLFSLYKLLQGSRAYHNQNYAEALDVLTRGFVRAHTGYLWVPEMLYLIGDCYAHSEHSTAARNVWTEITILYPDSLWAANATESLKQLPPSTPEASNTTNGTSQM